MSHANGSNTLIFDRDKKYSHEVLATRKSMGIERKQITAYSPWQNGVAERWVQTVRRDLRNHAIGFSERQLQRLITEFLAYDHKDRTHLGLAKTTPARRKVTSRPAVDAAVVAHPRLGGRHHRHEWREAAGRMIRDQVIISSNVALVCLSCPLEASGCGVPTRLSLDS